MRKLFTIGQRLAALAGGVLVAVALTIQAATTDLNQYLKPGHPDVYTVLRGDTLWDISGQFLERPWLWPELWQINPHIENPHVIYPGDQVSLVYVEGQPRLNLERGDAGRTVRLTPSDTVTLQPQIRATPLESAIPAIRLDAIQGFLVQNRVVEPEELLEAPYVLEGEVTVVMENEQVTLPAGKIFQEGPDVVMRAKNLSTSVTAKVVVFQVGDTGKPTSVKVE